MRLVLMVSLVLALFVSASCDSAEDEAEAQAQALNEALEALESEGWFGEQSADLVRSVEDVEGATPCDLAYNIDERIVELTPPDGRTSLSILPERAASLDRCNELPTEAQRCLAHRYSLVNDCSSVREEIESFIRVEW